MTGIPCAIIGSGNIGTDLMIKVLKTSSVLTMTAMVGIDPESDGLAQAQQLGVTATSEGLEAFTKTAEFDRVRIIFDATSAAAHFRHNEILAPYADKTLVDLTPAAIGPYTVPSVNMKAHLKEPNVNMVTCGGQATIPLVSAVSRVTEVPYAEIVASISSRSAGPGTRANIDEFTETTSRAIETVGGAKRGKAIIVLNPAEPPLLMRNTVFVLSAMADKAEIAASIEAMVATVQSYVPGYRLKQDIQFEAFGSNSRVSIPGYGDFEGLKIALFIEVEGAGHYLPAYAGNLDIMTSAALRTGEKISQLKYAEETV